MALPTTNLTLHCDASDTDKVFTTYNASGSHTGTPSDGSTVEVWDDEGDGVSDVAMIYTSARPVYRSTTPLMLNPCLDFAGAGSNEFYASFNQTGLAAKAVSTFVSASAHTMAIAFYPEAIV